MSFPLSLKVSRQRNFAYDLPLFVHFPKAFFILLMCSTVFCACGSTQSSTCASDIDCGGATSCDLGRCVVHNTVEHDDLRPQRVVLNPIADATVTSSSCCRNKNFSQHDLLAAGRRKQGGSYRTYLKFDHSEIGEAEILKAHLVLKTHPRWSQGSTRLDLLAFSARRQFSDRSLTWSAQPGGAGGPVSSALIRPEQNNTTVMDITDLVQGWSSGRIQNHGVVLISKRERSGGLIVWFSSEAINIRNRPSIEVFVR